MSFKSRHEKNDFFCATNIAQKSNVVLQFAFALKTIYYFLNEPRHDKTNNLVFEHVCHRAIQALKMTRGLEFLVLESR